MKPKKTGAKLFVECLIQEGVDHIFAIPGAKIDALFDALKDSSIKLTLCRHEQNACFQAQSYGRLTGRPGVVLVTSGPGVSNLVTGLLTATTEGDPVIAIGGNVSRDMKLKKSHQSCDNIKLTEGATKSSVEVLMVDTIPEIIQNAFRLAKEPRAGAVFISLPQDISHEMTDIEVIPLVPKPSYGRAPVELFDKACKILAESKSCAILLGLEASRPENVEAIRHFIEKTNLPVVSTYQAAGVISKDLLGNFVGRVGLFKNQPGDELIARSDVIITIGFSSVEYDPEIWNNDGNKRHVIHIDYIKAEIHRTYAPCLELLGDIASNLHELSSKIKIRPAVTEDLVKGLQKELYSIINEGHSINTMPVHPLRFIAELKKVVDEQFIITCDVGSNYMWMARYFFTTQPHHLLFSNGQQTLGVALPWALSAKRLFPNKHVISISGDGGFLFSAQELETAVREKLAIVHFVWVDGSYDMVKEQQMMKYHRDCCVDFGKVDFVKFAESFGAYGFKIKDPKDIAPTLEKALKLQGPALIEVPIDYSDNARLFEQAFEMDV
jgi:acetolactate synthase-1/2/3 large subunit